MEAIGWLFKDFKDKQIVAYRKRGNSAGWDLYVREPKKGRRGLKPRRTIAL